MKHFTPFILTLFIIFFSSCNNDDKAIRKTAQGYLDAMGNYQIEAAEPYATEETRNQTLRFVKENILPKTDTNYINSNRPASITLGEITYTTDTTATIAFHKSTPIKEDDGTLDLVKRNNQWQAQVIINVPSILRPVEPISDSTMKKKIVSITRTDSVPKLGIHQ
ncbi:MAG: hypothetical protein Q4D03_01285 [Bacteroidales bacterium]|nr:hypothetical protein [Bacteroidales bacterium]